jgi:threonine/homoserine/homoserine lactone efflux protein
MRAALGLEHRDTSSRLLSMALDQFLALVTLAVVGSFTPGPNNMIAAAIGANHGFRAVLPHMLGVVFGFTTMLVAGSVGLAALIAATPWMAALLKWGGIAYLMAIAWRIAGTSAIAEGSMRQPLTFWQSAVFQYANPKAWTIGMATLGTFASGGDITVRTAVICSVFAIIAFVSVGIWGLTGATLRDGLAVGRRLRVFNAVMGALLAGTAVWLAVR